MDLFDFKTEDKSLRPLADRLRPNSLDEFLGQTHILGKDSLIAPLIKSGRLSSSIFFGPPGTGKTTLAAIIAANGNGDFFKLNAVSSGVADAKAVIEKARQNKKMFSKRSYLLLDECHRWSKSQSDSVLAAIEDGSIIFIGSTTENPFVSMTRAIVSRCKIFELKPLENNEILMGLERAIKDKENGLGNYDIDIEKDALEQIILFSNGDLRTALNSLEIAVLSGKVDKFGKIKIDKAAAAKAAGGKVLSIDTSLYYDMLSAFCKSLRGSDPDASLYWAFRLIKAGCDPLLILRRLLAHASEDVGLADSNALVVATSALTAYQNMGLPEGGIPLAHAIVYVAKAKKSNSIILAKAAAEKLVEQSSLESVPSHLRDRSFPSPLDDGAAYIYPHDDKTPQEYMPVGLRGKKVYVASENDLL